MPKLLVLLPDGARTEYDLTATELTIGRGSNNTIKIDDSKASRNHCAVTKDSDGDFYIKDLDSRNGTKLNGSKIGARVKLKAGDVIRIGKTKFAFEKFPDNYSDDDDGGGVDVTDKAEVPKYVLEVVEGKGIGAVIELKDGITTFGRKPTNDVTIDDDKASGNHCEVRKEAMGYILVDLDSTNGTKFRASGKADFEKVTKVPLAVGSEFRVGQMVYRYKNIGAPSPDDEVLAEAGGGKASPAAQHPAAIHGGAAAATPSKPPAPPPAASPLAMAGLGIVVAVAVLAVVGYFILKDQVVTPSPDDNVKPPVALPKVIAIQNSDFQQPANQDGQPQHWTIGPSKDRQKLSEESDPKDKDPNSKNTVAVVDRSPAASMQSLFELQSEHLEITQGGVYTLTMRLRSTNDSEGPFGVKMQFFSTKGELLAEYPYLLTGSHDAWYDLKEKEFIVKAPDAPSYGQLELVAVGNKGKVFFDDVQVKYQPVEKAAALPADVVAGNLTFKPRDFTGAFALTVNSIPALAQGRVVLIDKTGNVLAGTECVSLIDMTENAPKAKIYNTAANEWIQYDLTATPTGKGITVAVNPKSKPTVDGTHIALLVDLVDNYSGCGVEGISLEGAVTRLAAPGEAVKAGAREQEILFSKDAVSLSMAAGRQDKLFFGIGRQTGTRRLITIVCDNPVDLYITVESETLARASNQSVDAIGSSVKGREWAKALQQIADFNGKYSSRFAALATKVNGYNDDIKKEADHDLTEAKKIVPSATTLSPEVAKPVLDQLNTLSNKWKDTPYQKNFQGLQADVSSKVQTGETVSATDIAQKFRELESKIDLTIMEGETDDSVNKLTAQLVDYQQLMLKFPDSDQGKAALEKYKGYDATREMFVDQNELLDAVQTFLKAGQFQQATDLVKNHPKFKKYPAGSMKRLEAQMKLWAQGKK